MIKDFSKLRMSFQTSPARPFRTEQQEALRFITDSPKKVAVVVAPTGSGKSLIGMVSAGGHQRSSYLCSSKNLQHQLTHDFPERPR